MGGEWYHIFNIISNAAFILPAVEYARRRHWTTAIIMILAGLSSSVYHTCNAYSGMCLGLSPATWRHFDFFFAQLVIPVAALYVIEFPPSWYAVKRIILVVFMIAIILVQHYFGESLAVQVALVGISFTLILIYWIVYAIHRKSRTPPPVLEVEPQSSSGSGGGDGEVVSLLRTEDWKRYQSLEEEWKRSSKYADDDDRLLPPYEWESFQEAISRTALACAFFVVELQTVRIYWAIHPLWHANAAFSQYFWAQIWPRKHPELVPDMYVSLDRPLSAAAATSSLLLYNHIAVPSRDGDWRSFKDE